MIYSLDKINEMSDGDQDFILSIVGVFLEEVPQDLADLESAIAAGDVENAYKLAHKLKPNMDILGMEGARVAALEIETIGKNNGSMDDIRSRFPILQQDINQAITELKTDFGL